MMSSRKVMKKDHGAQTQQSVFLQVIYRQRPEKLFTTGFYYSRYIYLLRQLPGIQE
jgi:hypothetical protein